MPSFMESLAFEIAAAQSELDSLKERRKKLKKKLKSLSQFLAEIKNPNPPEENPHD